MAKVIEFCCGYGGASQGIMNAGLEIEKAYDLWKVAVKAHLAWHPSVPCEVRDVKTIEPHELEGRIVWASLPCQPWSTANQVKRGKSHPSYYSLAHFAYQVQFAKFAILENVPGLLRMKDGKAELEELQDACDRLGLSLSINIFPSYWFGVQQLRERVIIVINAPFMAVQQSLFEKDGLQAQPKLLIKPPEERPENLTNAILATEAKISGDDAFGRIRKREAAVMPSDSKGSRFLPDGSWDSGAKRKARKLEQAVRATRGGGSDSPEWRKLARAPTATEHIGHSSKNPNTGEVNFQGRTVDVCAELQGVPLEYIKDFSKTNQYTLIGNAVPPPFAEAVMKHIMGAA